MKCKLFTLLPLLLLTATTVIAQDKMEVKDADSNLLMQVNDEGTAGSVSLPGLTAAPSVFANKLYNIGGVLYFNGTPLGSLWSQNGANLFFNTGNVGIGLNNPSTALEVSGKVTATGLTVNKTNPRVTFFESGSNGGTAYIEAQFNGTSTPDKQKLLFVIEETPKNGNLEIPLTLTADGNVGIKDQNPAKALSVDGAAGFTGNVTANKFFGDGSSLTNMPWTTSGSDIISNNTGNVGIGIAAPANLLHVEAAVDNDVLVNLTNSATFNAKVLAISSGSTGGSDILDVQDGSFVVQGDGHVGIGTDTPHSTLQVSGSFATGVTTTSSNLTLDASHNIVLYSGTILGIITLPTASGISGRQYTIKKIGIGNVNIAAQAGETVDNVIGISLTTSNEFLTVVSDGSDWWIVARG